MRDVVQNHLLQLLALIAMEPPSGGSDPDPVRDKKMDLFRAIPAADPQRCVRGQYDGYLDVEGVAPDSTDRDLHRPAPVRRELALGRRPLLHPRRQVPGGQGHRAARDPEQPAADRHRGQRRAEVRRDRHPDRPRGRRRASCSRRSSPARRRCARSTWSCCSRRSWATSPGPTSACWATRCAGDPEHFAREDMVEETWRIVQPLIDEPSPVVPYKPGGWGPEEPST